ncbi:basement membrane-specific heparan sulfate proteoglycan core protein-like isoform X3 [Apostichopus japonicus]|uniref:basement membrane-specific heparan sulfate proteoglycan core protein-like isoform X3 n=1 Tax=Stichopus japonicus TaxID=307972 RepID=UPI003AB7801C
MAHHQLWLCALSGCLLLVCLPLVARCQDLHLFKEENVIETEDELGDFYIEVSNDRLRRQALFDGVGSGTSTTAGTTHSGKFTFTPADGSMSGSSTTTAVTEKEESSSIRPPTTPPSDDEDMSGSGEGSGSGSPPTPTEVYSFIRFTIVAIDYKYSRALSDWNSQVFKQLKDIVETEVDRIYLDTPGTQFSRVFQFLESDYGVEIHIDLGTESYFNDDQLLKVLTGSVGRGSLGNLRVLSNQLSYTLVSNACEFADCGEDFDCKATLSGHTCIPNVVKCDKPEAVTSKPNPKTPSLATPEGTPTPSPTSSEGRCPSGQARCHSGDQCVLDEYRCDGDFDCDDESDEFACPTLLIPCEPNEFRCTNENCAQKIWLCDGDDDCGDGSDEANCPTAKPGDACSASEFECFTNSECVPKAFQCDNDYDCVDRSDEYACTPPNVTVPPNTPITVTRGETIVIRCVAVGTPTPIISWRLNWGPIPPPPRVFTTSEDGVGVLTITNAQESDSGAYTCEAMNNQGYILVVPDAIVIVIPPRGICQAPYFNSDADDSSECMTCYCFDRSRTCQSSSLFKTKNEISFDVANDLKGVELVSRKVPSGDIEYINKSRISVELDLTELIIIDFSQYLKESNYYWALPEQFLGNQLASYGGKLSYTVRYNPSSFSQQTDLSDVILKSGDVTLVYQFPNIPRPSESTTRELLMTQDNWYRETVGSGRGDTPGSLVLQTVTRQEFMNVLSNIEDFFIRASYYTNQRNSVLSKVYLEVGQETPTNNGRAFMVEYCQCPQGYGGLSCERCADGYMTDGVGGCMPCDCNGLSNECDPDTGVCKNCREFSTGENCDSCQDGYYGDPVSGIPCDPCPCPYISPPSQHSPTCYLDNDGLVTCDSCAAGYRGRDCGECEEDYTGNPRIIGNLCFIDTNECNTAGTAQAQDGECTCKRNAQGEACEQCVDGTYHLSEENQYGCISCFCMGVSRECGSTTSFRSQVQSQFITDSQGFTLTDRLRRVFIESNLDVNPNTGELSYQDFEGNKVVDSFYWNLPAKFLRDKISTYGGTLKYTIRIMNAAGASDMNGEPDVEIGGNGVTLLYRHREKPQEDSGRSYTVRFFEQYWTRMDGQPATREFLLMALADLDFILIRATYSSQPELTVLQEVSLDIAEARDTGLGRAYAVEQCVCPYGYTGLSCEDCDINFTRAGGGLYLGLCEECFCNGHSELCDPESGVCQDCQHNTQGPFCNECQDGFYGNAQIGTSLDCEPCPCPLTFSSNQFSPTCYYDPRAGPVCNACEEGYEGLNCERCAEGYSGDPNVPGRGCTKTETDCDSRGTARDDGRSCQCKAFVQGESCDGCAPGYYNMDDMNPDGCTPCFCSGITRECSSSDLYRQPIRLEFDSRDDTHNMVIRNRLNTVRLDTGFHINPNNDEIAFNGFPSLDANQNYFWELPPRYRGNKVMSYGGYLSYTTYYSTEIGGSPVVDADVEIFGNDIVLLHRHDPLPPGQIKSVNLQLIQENFVRPDSQPATREHLLMALADLEYILIRISYNTEMREVRLWEVSLDTSASSATNNSQAVEVEVCDCPVGYRGTSCEDCDRGFTRSGGGLYLGLCIPCECNGHSNVCDPETGVCTNCQHNTEGDSCQDCSAGFYGDATSGTNSDCRRCACPLTISSNQFAQTCVLDRTNGRSVCGPCDEGYTGPDCGECAENYVGNPRVVDGSCIYTEEHVKVPEITVTPAQISSIVRTSVTMYCNVDGEYDQIEWVREDGAPLPSGRAYQQSDNSLLIRDLMTSDNGAYICRIYYRGETGQGVAEARCDLTVTDTVVTVIIEEPKSLTVDIGGDITFVCRGSSEVAYTVAWMKQGGPLPQRAKEFMGMLTITNAVPSDSGTYVCTVSNLFDVVSAYATVSVVSSIVAPFNVLISPRFQRVTEGDRVEFRCTADGTPIPDLRWTRGRNNQLSLEAIIEDGVFIIPEVSRTDEDEYFCEAFNAGGMSTTRTILYVEASNRPVVTVNPPILEVEEGQLASFYCSVTGDPTPATTWTKLGGTLSANAVVDGSRLTFYRPAFEDAGDYVCNGVNAFGSDSEIATLVITREVGIPPVVFAGEENVVVSQGSTLNLICNATGIPQPTVSWSRAGGRALGSNMQERNGVLRIVDIRLEDRDVYTCTAENIFGRGAVSVIVDVERREPPNAEVFPIPNQAVTSGTNVQVQCRATAGYPAPEIVWTRAGGEPFTGNTLVENGVLRIIQITSDEQGVYLCTATNRAGSVQISITLLVLGLPQITISPETNPAEYEVGEPAILECYGTGDPVPSVHWMKRDDRVGLTLMDSYDFEEGRAVYYLPKLRVEDSGTYVCRAENAAGFVEKSMVLNVAEKVAPVGPPEIAIDVMELTIIEGGRAVFTCSSPGSPVGTYSVTWRRVGKPMPGVVSVSGGVLTFPATRSEDSGQYYCVVGNEFGFMQELVTLYILSPPIATVMPVSQTVTAGSFFRISCMADGTDPIFYEWSKVGGQLSPHAHDVDGMLEITKVTAADAGEYRCLSQNEAGRSEAFASITVQVSPQVTITPSSDTRAVGASVEFHCQATGSPPPQVIWSKEGGSLPISHSMQNGILTLSNLQPGDDGVYVCTATNRAGSKKISARLALQAPPDVAITVNAGYQFVAIGESVNFECRANGDPEPVIIWTKIDGELPITVEIVGGLLTIPQVQLSHSGLYKCTATNAVGSRSSEVLLYVQAAPQISVQPETRSVSIGASVVFTCFASGFPFPEITWYKEDSDLFPDDFEIDSGVLTLRNVKKEDAGTYVCSATNNEGTVEYKANLIIGDLVPYFTQMPQSYISYPKLANAAFEFEIVVSFKPESPEGLILYNGQYSQASSDFLSFGLSGGHAEFRFNLGGGAAIIRSEEPLELARWHTVTIRRDGRYGFMTVDDQYEVNGTSMGAWRGLDLVQNLYLGGVMFYEDLPLHVGFNTGFIGCVSQLKINDYKVFLTSGAISMVNVESCETCLTVTCDNGGECQEAFTENGFTCRCLEGFTGSVCQHSLEIQRCLPDSCGEGMCVESTDAAGFRCVCPPGLTGERCDIDLPVGTDDSDYEGSGFDNDIHMQNDYGSIIFNPSFVGDSYIAYEGLLFSQDALDITMMFKPNTNDDGLLLFNGQRSRGAGDYIALVLLDGKLVFQYDSGSGPAIIVSNENITAGQWYTIEAHRLAKEGSLVVNEGIAVKGISPGSSRGLNLQLPLYLGGVNDFIDIPRSLGIQKGFVGCITEVELNGEPFDLVTSAIGNSNVQECTDIAPCEKEPCENGATCLTISNSLYKCVCTEEYTGIHCETLVGPCLSAEPCENGGSCLPIGADAYQCMCPLGFSGLNCEKDVTLEDGAYFSGSGYLTLPKMTIPRRRGTSSDKEVLSFRFRTTDTDGLLLFQGAPEGEDGLRQDFIAISLNGGYIEFSYNLGSGPAEIVSRSRVNNGQEHTVVVSRMRKEGMLMIDDGAEILGESQGTLQMLNIQGNLYLGGAPDINLLTGSRFTEGAEVCISDLIVQVGDMDSVSVNFKDSAEGGVNVADCIV